MPAIKVLMPESELADIDRVRGRVPRERWIRELAQMAVKARDAFGEACLLKIRGVPSSELHQAIALEEEIEAGDSPPQARGAGEGAGALGPASGVP